MAVSYFSGGYTLGSSGDVTPNTSTITIVKIRFEKGANAGTMTLKDKEGTAIMTSDTLSGAGTAGSTQDVNFPGGWCTSGIEFDAISSGGGAVRVYVK